MTGEEGNSLLPGGSLPGSGEPAFRSLLPSDIPIPVVIASPHGGRTYPRWLWKRMRDPLHSSLRLEDRHIDSVAMQVAGETGAGLLVADAPRAMLDLNRATDDMDWEMVEGGAPSGHRKSLANRRSRSGLGLVPRRLPHHGEIWNRRLTRAEFDACVAGVHRPYHRTLGQMLEAVRDRWGAALLLDLHSMPPLRKRYPGQAAAEFVIGDRFGASCDAMISARTLDFFGREGRMAAHNRPYAGGYVLDRHAQTARGIHAVQLEICRSTYLDTQFAEPSARLPAIVRLLGSLVRELAACTASIGRERGLPLAAE